MRDYNTLATVCKMLEAQASYSQIRNRTGIGNSSITRVKRLLADSGISLPDFEQIWKELNDPSVPTNIVFQWLRYKEEYPNGYQRTQFVKYVSDWIKEHHGKTAVRMVVQRKPGEKMYIDWAGTTLPLVHDLASGSLKEAHLFVTTLGVSSLLFVCAFENEKAPSVAEGVSKALRFYGAFPRYLVLDNMLRLFCVTQKMSWSSILYSAISNLFIK